MNIFDYFKSSSKKSKNVAKDRLKLVLIHDRGDFSPEKKQAIKNDLMEVLSKYVEIEPDEIRIEIVNQKDSETGEKPQISASIPFKSFINR